MTTGPYASARDHAPREILVVDDDLDIREALGLLLKGEGYQVRLAENGAVALEAIRSPHKFDLMLLDLMMPVMSGFELLEMLKDGDPDLRALPIFVVSAGNAALSRNARAGVERCFAKPFDADVLLAAIHERLHDGPAHHPSDS